MDRVKSRAEIQREIDALRAKKEQRNDKYVERAFFAVSILLLLLPLFLSAVFLFLVTHH